MYVQGIDSFRFSHMHDSLTFYMIIISKFYTQYFMQVLVAPPPWLFLLVWAIIIVTQSSFVFLRLWRNRSDLDESIQEDHDADESTRNLEDHGIRTSYFFSIQTQYELKLYIISCVFQIFWTLSTCEQVMAWSIFFITCHIMVMFQLIGIEIDNITQGDMRRNFWMQRFPHELN